MDNWSAIAKVYDPLKAGSIDATDTEPHDHGIIRAMAAKYKPNKDVIGDPEKTIFIARLNPKTDETTIQKVYSGYGVIKQFRLVRDIITGYSRCYAFVEYYDHKEAEDAVWRGHKQEIDGCEVFVDYECERVLKGWVPRRLGGGFGGKKESGQLRFGGRDRPFRKPIYNKMIALKNVNNDHYDNAWDDKSSEHDADGHENYRGTNRVRSDRSNPQYYENLNKFKTSEKIQSYRERQQSKYSFTDRSRERHQTRDRSKERDQRYSRYDKSSRDTSLHQSKHSRETAGERRGSNRDRDRIRSSDGPRDRIRDDRSRDRSRDRSGERRGDNRSRDRSRDRSGERRKDTRSRDRSRDRSDERRGDNRSRDKSRDRSGERRHDRSEKRGKISRDSKRDLETSEDREREKYIDRKIDKGKHLERSDYRGQSAPETYDERTINRLIQSTMSSIWDEHDNEHDNEQNQHTENKVTEDLEVPEN